MSDDSFKIEKSVPIPRLKRYPFDELKVSDSFLAKLEDGEPIKRLRSNINSAVYSHNKKQNGKKFCARSVDGGMRVWRTE